MKKFRKSIVIVMALAAILFTFTACSKSDNHGTEEVEAIVDDADEPVDEVANEVETMDEEVATEESSGMYAWSSDLDNWVLSCTGSKTITLDGITGEGELSAEGRNQLDVIMSILESNEELKATVKGHVTADQRIGNGKLKAEWTRVKLIVGHDAAKDRISAKGVGSKEPIEGVDANDKSQNRITVTFAK